MADWVEELNALGVAAAKICSIAEALRLPIARERDAVFPFVHPKAGEFRTVGTALVADGKPWRATLPPPTHGEHDEEVLGVPAAVNMAASM